MTKGKEWKKKCAKSDEQAGWGGSSSSSEGSYSFSRSPTPPAHPKPKKTKKDDRNMPGLELSMSDAKKVAVDWHKVLQINNYYDEKNTEWLQKLKDSGYEVHLLSYCGYQRSQEVYAWAWSVWDGWACVSFTWSQCGFQGEARWCLQNMVSKVTDDNLDICVVTKRRHQGLPNCG